LLADLVGGATVRESLLTASCVSEVVEIINRAERTQGDQQFEFLGIR
jgi:hypothetical protein